jgi:EAL domain-containing protein (putative c-di-GMP-specific phosphodiesterase class I)
LTGKSTSPLPLFDILLTNVTGIVLGLSRGRGEGYVMRYALSEAIRTKELFVLYQPQVSVEERRIVTVEALVRWERTQGEVVPPSDFVPFAEQNELIDPLGAYVMERACQDAAKWKGLRIALNVSQKQFALPDLADFICTVAQDNGLELADLEVEVTETADFPDRAAAIDQLKILHMRGVSVSLDDLGSGSATKELMEALPLSRVKLGRPLVEFYQTSEGAERLRDLIGAAQALGLGVTAEGVETKNECEFLRALGCDLMQGFFFSKPLRAEEVMDVVATSHAKWRAS